MLINGFIAYLAFCSSSFGVVTLNMLPGGAVLLHANVVLSSQFTLFLFLLSLLLLLLLFILLLSSSKLILSLLLIVF